MKERITAVLGYVDEAGQSSRAGMVVLMAKGETWGEVLMNLQARIESVAVLGPGDIKPAIAEGVAFTPLS